MKIAENIKSPTLENLTEKPSEQTVEDPLAGSKLKGLDTLFPLGLGGIHSTPQNPGMAADCRISIAKSPVLLELNL